MEYSDYPLSSWTLRKVRMMEFCPRGALLHYVHARAGADPEAPAEVHYLHTLKCRISRREYISRLVRGLLREYFRLDPELQTPADEVDLYPMLVNRFEKEYISMLTGSSSVSARHPVLMELYEPDCRTAWLASEIKTALADIVSALNKTILPLLHRLPPENKRHLPTVLETHINELTCYFSPLFIFENNGDLWFVEEGIRDERVAVLHKFYALNVLGWHPERVKSFCADLVTGGFEQFGIAADISQALRDITEDCARWEELRDLPLEMVQIKEKNCNKCKFREFCRQGT